MDKYYEKYAEVDPIAGVTAQVLGFELLKQQAHKHAEQRRKENAKRAAADKTKSYKIIEHNGIQYIRKLLNDSLKKADTWNERLRIYNELFVNYLERKSYEIKMWYEPSHYALSLKEYKEIVKHESSLKEQK